jgi:RHS repeat-associated protein
VSASGNSAVGAASAADAAAPKPPAPLIAPTGNASANVLVGDLDQVASPFQDLGANEGSPLDKANDVIGGILGAIQAPVTLLNDGFALATAGIAKLFPPMPAATLGMLHLGFPHIHDHPPAFPEPLPSLGPVALAGCASVLINGVPAARAGDLGIGLVCGSLAPPFEVFTGSSKVFIGGARAARMLDITKHCQPGEEAEKAAGLFSKVMAVGGHALGVIGIGSEVLGAVASATDPTKQAPAAVQTVDGTDPKKESADAAAAITTALAAAAAAKAASGAAAAVSGAGSFDAQADAADGAADAADAAAAAQEAAAEAAAQLKADLQADADAAQANAEAEQEAQEAAAEASADAAADAAAQAKMAGIQAGLDAAAMALSFLMGMDPGEPPCYGALLTGMPNVLIGGFPMPPWSEVARGLGKLGKGLAKRLAKLSPTLDRILGCRGLRLTGHPIDVVTGANVDELVDYVDPGSPSGFRWVRSYTSLDAERDGPMGRGFQHSYQRDLVVDLDYAIYTDGQGRVVPLPLPTSERESTSYCGYVLTVGKEGAEVRYSIDHAGEPTVEFVRERRTGAPPRLVRLRSSDARVDVGYDALGQMVSMVETSERGDRSAKETRLAYDGRRHVVEVRRGTHGTGELPLVARYAYDAAGSLIEWEDALGARGSYAYDRGRRLTRMTDRNGYSFHFTYDAEGRCIEEHGDDGLHRVSLRYEPERRRTMVTKADGGVWIYEYDEQGALVAIQDHYGGRRTWHVAKDGRVLEEVAPDGHTSRRFLYDRTGYHFGVTDRWRYLCPPLDEDPNPSDPLAINVPETPLAQQFGYFSSPSRRFDRPSEREPEHRRDAAGRAVETVYPDGSRERFGYDPAGNTVVFVDRDGREYRTAITSWNLVGAEIDPLGHRTHYEYTPHARISTIVDPGGSVSRYEYDFKDRLVRVLRHGVVREEYVYDEADQLIEKRDGAGNLLLRRSIGDNGLPRERRLSSGEVYRYEYDGRGRETLLATEGQVIRRNFDGWGRLMLEERNGRGVRHRFTGGALAETTYFGRFRVAYRRGGDGALEIQAPVGGVQRFVRGDMGRVLSTLGNGTTVDSSYDDQGRCSGRTVSRVRDGEPRRWSTRYSYSPEGELHRIEDSQRGITTYGYDAAHRLCEEVDPRGAVTPIALDDAGNLRQQAGLPPVEIADGNRLRCSGHERFTYNDRNHLAEIVSESGGATRYSYNGLDMLVEIQWSDREERWTAGYDGLRRRTFKSMGGRRTEYFWDDNRLAAEIGPEGALRLYVYPDPQALVPVLFIDYDGVDAAPETGRALYVIGNQIGAPLLIEDQRGEVVWWANSVEPYGVVRVHPSASVSYALRFPGHYLDEETGLHYNRFRYYAPRLGRYLQSDPIGHSGGINLYAYPANPLVDVDVLGLTGDCAQVFRFLDGDREDSYLSPAAKKGARRQEEEYDRVLRIIDSDNLGALSEYMNRHIEADSDFDSPFISVALLASAAAETTDTSHGGLDTIVRQAPHVGMFEVPNDEDGVFVLPGMSDLSQKETEVLVLLPPGVSLKQYQNKMVDNPYLGMGREDRISKNLAAQMPRAQLRVGGDGRSISSVKIGLEAPPPNPAPGSLAGVRTRDNLTSADLQRIAQHLVDNPHSTRDQAITEYLAYINR